MVLSYPMRAMVDRIHPLRVKLVVQVAFCVLTLMKCVFLFYDFPRDVAFWIYAACWNLHTFAGSQYSGRNADDNAAVSA